MSTLQIRGLPQEVKDRLQELARREKRSLNAQAALLLTEAVDRERHRETAAESLLRADEIREAAPKRRRGADSLAMLHRGRAERRR